MKIRFERKFLQRDFEWFFVILGSGGLFFGALFYQYFFDMQPCYLCIQQRALVFGVFLTSSIGYALHLNKIHSPTLGAKIPLVISILLTIVFSSYAMDIAASHIDSASAGEFSYLFSSCGTGSPFPSWLALDDWFPSVFGVKGSCDGELAKAFGIDMPEYIKFFSVLATVLCCVKLFMAFKDKE